MNGKGLVRLLAPTRVIASFLLGLSLALPLAGCGSSSPEAPTSSGSSPGGGSPGNGAPGTVPPLAVGCDWVLVYDPAQPALANYAFPETSARYWIAVGPSSPNAGDALLIDGRYPDARYSSLTVYNGNGGFEDALADYQFQATTPGSNPFQSATQRNPAGKVGANYPASLLFDTAVPAAGTRAANTLYRPAPAATDSDHKKRTLLTYRTYVAAGDNSGGVGLPILTLDAAGVKTPLSKTPDSAACATIYANFLQAFGNGKSNLGGEVLTPAAPLPTPRFTVYRGVAGGAAGQGQFYNANNSFMSVDTSSSYGELLLIRARAPSHTDQPGLAGTPDVRYWSICQNGAMSEQVVQCVRDRDAALDSAGFYTFVIAVDGQAPAGATAARGFNVLPFGSESTGKVIYRQLLAAPDYAQAIDKVGPLQNASTVMGDAYPQATYCSTATFEAAAGSAAAAFAACQATP